MTQAMGFVKLYVRYSPSMFACTQFLVSCIFILTFASIPTSSHSLAVDIESNGNNLLLNVVKQIQNVSHIPIVHVFNHNLNSPIFPLAQLHHRTSIPTIIGLDHYLNTNWEPKIILFSLNACSDIFSLIFSSVQPINRPRIPSEKYQTSLNYESFFTCTSSRFLNYCIDYTEGSRTMRYGKECDMVISVSETDLQPGFEMSDSLFELTRGVFQHPVWNGENYLIFVLPLNSNADYVHCDLLFTFKFMWRLYQGFRTVICIGEKCLRYDPFRGSIDILKSDAYFSSLPDLMGHDLRIAITSNGEMFDRIISLKNWSPLAHKVMELIAEEMGGKFYETGFPDDVREDNSMALKRDIDVMIFESSLTSTDFNRLEVITLIDHGEISFIVPDLGFMPSYLTPAKCFSVTVWFFILGVLVLFGVVHEIYLRLSIKMYPEATAGISTAFTIFSYSICVGHSRLLLGSVTGRILFMVTTFAFMILTTVFLSLMTTFFSEQVRYTPLDTVDDLRESDVMFQLMGTDDEKFSFLDDPKYEWLKKRVKNSLESYVTELAEPTNTVVSYMVESDELIIMGEPLNASKLTVREMYKGIAAIIENDGFVAFLPRNAKKRDLLSVSSAPYSKQKFIDFHVVEEPIMSYPYDMRIQRGSVYGDVIRSYAARLAEAGILEELYELKVLGPVFHERFRRFEDDKSELPKVFNMADLRLAFFILIFGHLVSSLVFVSELLYSK